MMGASGKGRARRGAQAERAVPDLAEAGLTTRSADRLARRQHVKGEARGLLQARGDGVCVCSGMLEGRTCSASARAIWSVRGGGSPPANLKFDG